MTGVPFCDILNMPTGCKVMSSTMHMAKTFKSHIGTFSVQLKEIFFDRELPNMFCICFCMHSNIRLGKYLWILEVFNPWSFMLSEAVSCFLLLYVSEKYVKLVSYEIIPDSHEKNTSDLCSLVLTSFDVHYKNNIKQNTDILACIV